MSSLYVVFVVGGAEYALPASVVLQLEPFQGATPVPGTPDYVAGIVQVRGHVIPVIDLSRLFGRGALTPTFDTRIVVTERGGRRVGLLVEKSREVLRVEPASLQATPGVIEENSRGFVEGLAQIGARTLMLISLSKVIGEDELNVESPKHLEPGSSDVLELPGAVAAGVARNDGVARPEH